MNSTFFVSDSQAFLLLSGSPLSEEQLSRVSWLLQASPSQSERLSGRFIGPRKEIVSPWSTNATEILRSSGVDAVSRIERFRQIDESALAVYDRMTEALFDGLSQDTLLLSREATGVEAIESLAKYNAEAGLALSDEEIRYLEDVAEKMQRPLTDAEVYAFSQINSEHCRHKIFNGSFVIDGKQMPSSLFALIKDTSKAAPDYLVSAYKDNVAFIRGPRLNHYAPREAARPSEFGLQEFDAVLSLKAETHNFPTTVEPFYGASTGGGGEIRDRMAGGMGSFPLAGTAVYMTAHSRLPASAAAPFEALIPERNWKYQTPSQILVKASNGASDFGNKFGQPLICGSVMTYEGKLGKRLYAYDRCIMLAGGVGFAKAEHAQKGTAAVGDVVVVLGGDNYRIGMAGGSVSSVDTGALSEELELSAVQRANPEMQKRVYNAIRSLCELSRNPIKLIHDHGAGGHVNCLSELLEDTGGIVSVDALPLGDPTLSPLEILCNESQERMGLLLAESDVPLLQEICERERAPMYVVGEVRSDGRIVFEKKDSVTPFDLSTEVLFGSSPQTVLSDSTELVDLESLSCPLDTAADFTEALERVLSLEAVACKDWLTNKVDRCVTGLVAQQQCVGPLQLPLADFGLMALDYTGQSGIATSIGHAPQAGLIDARAGAELSVIEALTNIVFAPLAYDLGSVVLSANWMWPAKQSGEDARLYSAVHALSEFCQALGIAVPTGKDSLSMTMKYETQDVRAPGTVIVSAMAETGQVTAGLTPAIEPVAGTALVQIDFSGLQENPLGATALAQGFGELGESVASGIAAESVAKSFRFVQEQLAKGLLMAGHDVSAGGLITALCEMAFAGNCGIDVSLSLGGRLSAEALFTEKPGVVVQVQSADVEPIVSRAKEKGIFARKVAEVTAGTHIQVSTSEWQQRYGLAELRRKWFKQSYLLDTKQTEAALAKERYESFDKHPLQYVFPEDFDGSRSAQAKGFGQQKQSSVPLAAVLRDKGTNGDREMAVALEIAGFRVRDVTTSDLRAGREDLSDVSFLVFPGGFSNSDVLGAGRGWAGSLRYDEQSKSVLDAFYARGDTLSLGVCNGCQVMAHLDLLGADSRYQMLHNDSGKFESAFVSVTVRDSNSIMLQPLLGCELGIWVAHGEGRFVFEQDPESVSVAMTYCTSEYPANPNGSQRNAAGICSADGRHLVMMPHLERSMFAWSWPYRLGVEEFEVSPWALAFQAAFKWCQDNQK